MKVLAIIPSRYNSSRFPGKPLADIMGKSMVQRVFEQCQKCDKLNRIIVATDDERISFHVKSFGGEVMMTAKDHTNGTNRCGEVLNSIDDRFDVVVNVQGDEPYIMPEEISKLLSLFEDENTQIATLAKEITEYETYKNLDNPKIYFNKENIATSFERKGEISEEEFSKNTCFQHIGIYAYKTDILSEITRPKERDQIEEDLEQLKWMREKYKIKVGISSMISMSVDREEDIEEIKRLHINNS